MTDDVVGTTGDAGSAGDAGTGDDADSAAAAQAQAREDGSDDAYGGIIGAFPYAVRASDSLALRAYAIVSALLSVGVALLFGMALVVLIGATAGVAGGSFTFSRAFFVLLGLFVVAPLVAPVLFVARSHRRGAGDARYDATLGGLGFLFVASLYVGLVVSTPVDQQESVVGVLAPLIEVLYGLPRFAGLVPPLLVTLLIWRVGRDG